MNINPYINERGSDHSYDENQKLLHVSALPDDINEHNDVPSPFNNAINLYKFNNAKANNKRQNSNYYQSSTMNKRSNKFVANKSRLLCAYPHRLQHEKIQRNEK